jgi:SAM-dependent methyltransferase
MTTPMETVDCLLCGRSEHRVRYRGRDRMGHGPGEFTLVECCRCGFLYLSPRPDATELPRYYPSNYEFYQSTVLEDPSAFSRANRQYDLAKRCDLVLRQRSSGDLLDVGAAVGDFLAAMRARPGWRVRGLELDAGAADHARRVYGLTVDQGDLESVRYPPCSFDVVTLWEVIEHLPQPRHALRCIHTLLRPGGAMVMSLPNRRAMAARLFGPYWLGLDVPRHFSVFSPADISHALQEAGFERPHVFTPRGHLGATHNGLLCGMASLHFWLAGDGPQTTLQSWAATVLDRLAVNPRAVVSLFVLTLPYSWLIRALNRGTQMIVVAHRP